MRTLDFTFQIALFGPRGAGKKRLLDTYCSSLFNSSSKLITGVDYYAKTIEINDIGVKFQIWDMSEEERFQFVLSQYCKGKNAGLLIFDLTEATTIDFVLEWIRFVREKAGDLPLLLIGDKAEGEGSAEVLRYFREKGRDIAKELYLIAYIEISTRTGDNVDKMFMTLADNLIKTLNR